MNQIAISVVAIRLFGVYMLFQTIVKVFSGILIPQIWTMLSGLEGAYPSMILGTLIATIVLGILSLGFIIYAKRISEILFPGNSQVILEGKIDVEPVLSIGLIVLGVFLFTTNISYALQTFFNWYSLHAENVQLDLLGMQNANMQALHYLIIMGLSFGLIFRGRKVASWLSN